MHFFNQFVISPDQEHLVLLGYLQVLSLLIHLPYAGMVIGGTLFSVILNILDRDNPNPLYSKLTGDLMGLVAPNKVVVLVFGILPLIALWIIYGQWLYGSAVKTMGLLGAGIVFVVAGLILVLAYRATLRPGGSNSPVNLLVGCLAVALLLLAYYIVMGSVTRFNDPERWRLAHNPVRLLTSWNVIWKYMYFLMSAFAVTGVAALFFWFDWPGRGKHFTAEYASFAKNFGAGVAISAILLMPPLGVLYLRTTSTAALTGELYWLFLAVLVILFGVFALLYRVILSPKPRFGTPVYGLFIMTFFLTIVGDHLTLASATREHSAALVAEAEKREALIAMEREARAAAGMKVDLARGEDLYNTVCTTCHRMDSRLVGPPLRSVLPGYATDLEGLTAFIQNPTKKNPDYPPMPAPGLSTADAKSVAAYLLDELRKLTPEGEDQ